MLTSLRAAPGVLVQQPPSPARMQVQIPISNFRTYSPKNNMRVQKVASPLPPPILPSMRKPVYTIPQPKIQRVAHCATPTRCFAPHQICAPGNQPKVAKVSYPPTKQNTAAQTLRGIGNNRVLIIIAAGPSIKEIDFTKLKDHPLIDVMCINKPYPPLWPTKFWSFCDHSQYIRNTDMWDKYNGTIINSTNVRARKPNQIVISGRSGKGWSTDIVSGYYVGRSSTYASMQVSLYMNYKKVFICGVDMGDGAWWYGNNPDVSSEVRQKRFADEAQYYLWAGQKLDQSIRDRFVFCSTYNKWEFMKYFPRLDQKIVVDEVLKFAEGMQK